ncbi:MAG TPA: sialate O-acetylesterase [Opitutaceae bacterium]|nr:sialate O-acetylesterase [Opitutaceae bacterium]
MIASKFVRIVLIGLALSHALFVTAAEGPLPFLSPVFGDNMVLQRGKPNTFWGWTAPGETVRVEIGDRVASGVADADGRWEVRVDPPPVGTEFVVRVKGSQEVELQNVVVGDVWLCGGQSNMQTGLAGVVDGAREVAEANHPQIRFFTVATRAAHAPVAVPQGMWKVCSPQTASGREGISAVAYFFARRVQAETGVPIGLIQNSLGGAPAESWMDPETLGGMEDFAVPMAKLEELRASGAREYGSFLMNWLDEYDAGLVGATWADPSLDDSDWKRVNLLNAFESFGLSDVPAVVWFRREFDLPDSLQEGLAVLHLGEVEKLDTAYVNGTWVGASSWVENPRTYRIASDLLQPGRNSITIRVLKRRSKNGFLSASESIRLALPDGKEIPLAGDWRAKVSVDARPPHPLPLGYENYPTMPAVMFHGMIAPIAPLAIAGALWYQGEANSNRAFQYRTLLPAMIEDWRRAFGQGQFPFYIVSLPAFQARKAKPGTDDWAELREAQAISASIVPNSGLVVTIDTGEADNIHPRDKKPVGERLALLALANHHGREVIAHGPVFRSMEREGNSIRLHFDHTEGGLRMRGDQLGEFSVAGEEKEWHWADARIDGDSVVVSSVDVPEPIAVRYAWQANPLATLENGAGLPAAPFRTDDWPGVTEGRPPW